MQNASRDVLQWLQQKESLQKLLLHGPLSL